MTAEASFADLVDAARSIDEGAVASAAEGCLIDRRGVPRMAADVLVGARPLASPPPELGSVLRAAAGPVAVFSAWGSWPGEALELALVAFTTTTPASARLAPLAAILTREGVFLRSADMAVRAHPEPLTIAAAGSLLTQLREPTLVYVSAEASIPLAQLTDLLRAVPNRFEIALAVALPKGTRLPAKAPEDSAESLCPDGLPAPRDDEAEGDLDAAAIRGALGPLRDQALACALSAGGVALLGGKLLLALRVGPDGRPRELCLLKDTIGELRLRRCVIAAARALHLPAPNPRGFVDVHLPLDLALEGPPAQRPLCE